MSAELITVLTAVLAGWLSLAGLMLRLGARIDRVDAQLRKQIDQSDARLTSAEARLGARIDQSGEQLGERIDRVEVRLTSVEARLILVEKETASLRGLLEGLGFTGHPQPHES